MPRRKGVRIDEKKLTKGQVRKLNALRKSLGDRIAEKSFAEWYATYRNERANSLDKDAKTIADALWRLVQSKQLRITRKGYVVKRGRNRLIVESAST